MRIYQSVFLLISLLFMVSPDASAQMDIPYDTIVLKKASKEMCSCLDGIDLESIDIATEQENSDKMQFCMALKIFKYRKELNIYTDKSDDDFDEEIAREIGKKISPYTLSYQMKNCPAFFQYMLVVMDKTATMFEKMMEGFENMETDSTVTDTTIVEEPSYDEDETEVVEEPYEEGEYESAYKTIDAKIKALKNDGYLFLVVEDEQGQSMDLLWSEYFENSDLLLTKFKKYKKKKVQVEYLEEELFNGKTQQYQNFKKITYLEFMD